MNGGDLVHMVMKAGGDDWKLFRDFMPEIEKLAQFIVEAERERAAMICHQYRDWQDNPAEAIAEAILQGE